MPAKKAAKSRSAAKKKSSPGRYRCPNTGAKLNLRQMISKMADDRSFAAFIRGLLQAACHGDKAAEKCLESYFQPLPSELGELCLTPREKLRAARCTEQNNLIQSAAYALSWRKELRPSSEKTKK